MAAMSTDSSCLYHAHPPSRIPCCTCSSSCSPCLRYAPELPLYSERINSIHHQHRRALARIGTHQHRHIIQLLDILDLVPRGRLAQSGSVKGGRCSVRALLVLLGLGDLARRLWQRGGGFRDNLLDGGLVGRVCQKGQDVLLCPIEPTCQL